MGIQYFSRIQIAQIGFLIFNSKGDDNIRTFKLLIGDEKRFKVNSGFWAKRRIEKMVSPR